MAADRLIDDFKLGMGVIIKAEKDHGSGGFKLQCIRSCHIF